MPPPTDASLGGTDFHSPVRFADPPTVERQRRSGQRETHLWYYDAERLCLVVWLFDLPPTQQAELRLTFDRDALRLAQAALQPLAGSGAAPPALGAMRRAQAAKGLLDATYPETQPQDYDQATWLAGLGSRLAWLPANFSRELVALPAVVKAARAQLKAEPAKRASSGLNSQRVRNATALLEEIGAR